MKHFFKRKLAIWICAAIIFIAGGIGIANAMFPGGIIAIPTLQNILKNRPVLTSLAVTNNTGFDNTIINQAGGSQSGITAGTMERVQLEARDQNNQIMTSFTGKVILQSCDLTGTTLADAGFVNATGGSDFNGYYPVSPNNFYNGYLTAFYIIKTVEDKTLKTPTCLKFAEYKNGAPTNITVQTPNTAYPGFYLFANKINNFDLNCYDKSNAIISTVDSGATDIVCKATNPKDVYGNQIYTVSSQYTDNHGVYYKGGKITTSCSTSALKTATDSPTNSIMPYFPSAYRACVDTIEVTATDNRDGGYGLSEKAYLTKKTPMIIKGPKLIFPVKIEQNSQSLQNPPPGFENEITKTATEKAP